jgi:hypothetical protein
MTGTLSREEIIHDLNTVSKELADFCHGINDESFFQQPKDKWSIAQNVKHLIIATNRTGLAFLLPKFIVRYYVGKPNRSSRTYCELIAKYKLKLEQGGRAGGAFIPKPVSEKENKEKILNVFSGAMNRLAVIIHKKWKDAQLDQYIAPHPLLGKITLRELCYFTIYHTQHHLNIIKERLITYQTADKLS